MEDVSKSGESLASKLKNGLATAGRVAATGIGAITAAAGAAVGGLLALEQSTEEYRAAMGRLTTAYENAGLGANVAQYAYKEFYSILGDTDTATEASQLLAQLATNGEDVAYWTHIAAGVSGTFGDSLPIESLIEAANETAKTGTVTGTLADALNWGALAGETFGVTMRANTEANKEWNTAVQDAKSAEDYFNLALQECSTESERQALIMNTLMDAYDSAADSFWANNEALVASRDAQAQMDAVLAQLGQTVSNIRSQLTAEFLPSIANVATAFNNMLNGAEGADQQFSAAVQGLVNQGVSLLPQFLNFGTQILTSLLSGIVQSIPTLVSAVPQVVSSIVEALSSLLPQVGAMGVRLLEQMSTGIVEGLPNLIETLPQVVESILDFITDNLPAFLEKGVEMLNYFVTGIIDAIPDMLAQLPAIITSFVSFVVENLPKIVQAGMDILSNLVIGIIDNFPEIGNAVGQIMAAIVQGIIDLLGAVIDAGKQIVAGIWQGITSMGSWITEKVTGFFGGIIDGVKDFLGIHSPSTVFADMGRNMALGLGEGWDNEYDRIRRNIEGGLDFGTANVDFASSGLGVASAGMVNGISSAFQDTSGGTITVNLMMPDGTKFASYLLGPLSNYAKANGTPILNPT